MTPDQLQASLQENQANQTAEQGPTLTEGEYNLDEVLSLRKSKAFTWPRLQNCSQTVTKMHTVQIRPEPITVTVMTALEVNFEKF